jgi:hypothetical protein
MNGAINAVINAAIKAWLLRVQGPVPLSADAISSTSHTALSGAVPLAVSLAMILTIIVWLTPKGLKRPFLPDILLLIAKHGVLAFGILVTAAVLWQRAVGTVSVPVWVAVIVLGLIAGLVAAVVQYYTALAAREPRT